MFIFDLLVDPEARMWWPFFILFVIPEMAFLTLAGITLRASAVRIAKSHDEKQLDPNKGNLRATGESKTAKNLQSIELQELIDVILANKEKRRGWDSNPR